jgi:hypothetical protein
MTKQHRTAPDPEWVQMYRLGIQTAKIAAGAGAAESTVRYHLGLAVKADPSLRNAHKSAAGKVTRRTWAGARNLRDVLAFHEAEGRLPVTSGRTARKRALGVWLHRRRQEAAAGTLSPVHGEALGVIPDWEILSTVQADNVARWDRRLTEVAEYRAAGHDWPRHQKADTEQERVLGVWLHVQRIRSREGKLSADRAERLDAAVPGWREGRTRSGGRRTRETKDEGHRVLPHTQSYA